MCSFDDALPHLMFYEKKTQGSNPWNSVLDIGEDFRIPITGRIKVSILTADVNTNYTLVFSYYWHYVVDIHFFHIFSYCQSVTNISVLFIAHFSLYDLRRTSCFDIVYITSLYCSSCHRYDAPQSTLGLAATPQTMLPSSSRSAATTSRMTSRPPYRTRTSLTATDMAQRLSHSRVHLCFIYAF